MLNFFADLRYALRQLLKSPGFSGTAILTLALSIGAVTAVFSVVNSVLLEPYAFRDPGRLVVWRETEREISKTLPVLPDNYKHYLLLKAKSQTVADATILQNTGFSLSVNSSHPEIVHGLRVSSNFFSVLGVQPSLGRAFLPQECQKGSNNAIILSWPAWQRLFHGDLSVMGKTVRNGGEPNVVVGVLPKEFRFPTVSEMAGGAKSGSTVRYEAFQPLVPAPDDLTADASEFNYLVVARLHPGVTVRQAQDELDHLEKASVAAGHIEAHLGVIVQPLSVEVTGQVDKDLWLLMAAVTGVLLIACVNLAGLQLARAVARDGEMALRSALGAGKRRLIQTALAESALLALAGSMGGVVLASFGLDAFRAIAPATLPRLNELHLSWPLLLLAGSVSVITVLGFGFLPALRFWRIDPQAALQANTARAAGSRHALRTRNALVTVEVALTVVLLILTGLVGRSFSRVLTENRNFKTGKIVVAEANLFAQQYSDGGVLPDNPGSDPGSLARDKAIAGALESLRTLPGSQAAAVTSVMPLTGETSIDGLVRPDHPLPETQVPLANLRLISPGYLSTMQIPLLSGRDFSIRDRTNPRVAILSEKTARAVWPEENLIGRTFKHWGRNYTVVGVAADARINNLKQNGAVFYLPYWDYPPFAPVFLLRNSLDAGSLAQAIRTSLWHVDPEIAIPTVRSLDSQVSESVAVERFQTVLLGAFGAAALFLAVLGIYGVLAYSVSLRIQEFGIRAAVGAAKASLVRLVLVGAIPPVAGGVVLGLLLAWAGSRSLQSMLYETSASDPLAIGVSVALILGFASLAASLPAVRASQVDPVRVLRDQ